MLPKGKPLRVYGLLGDAFLQKSATTALLEWCLPADARDFNLDSIDGDGTRITDLLGLCGNLPFLADHRVVLVKHAERLEGMQRGDEPKEKSKASPAKRFAEGIARLPDSTILILSRSAETPEPGSRPGTPRCINTAVDKAIEDKIGVIVNCTIGAKEGGLATALVQEEAERRGILLDSNAAAHLVNRLGHDLQYVLCELEKCALRAGSGVPVSIAVIDEMTRRTAQETVFNLTDAIGARRTAHAVGLLRELIEAGETAESILPLLVRHLRQLLQARTFVDAGLMLDANLQSRLPAALAAQLPKEGDLANWLRAQGWIGGRLTQQARNFTVPQIERGLQYALETDLALKGIEGDGGPPELLLELLITKMC